MLQACLDCQRVSKKTRAYVTFIGIFVYMAFTWAFGGYIQYRYAVSGAKQGLDFDSEIRPPWDSILCLFLWGFVDSFVQVWSYWMMSQQTNEPGELACMTAFYKLWQNAGAFISFLLAAFVPGFTFEVSYWVNVALIIIVIFPTLLAICKSPVWNEDLELARDVKSSSWCDGSQIPSASSTS